MTFWARVGFGFGFGAGVGFGAGAGVGAGAGFGGGNNQFVQPDDDVVAASAAVNCAENPTKTIDDASTAQANLRDV